MKTPTPVATPLPPRNFSQTGKQWPRIAATDEAAIHRGSARSQPGGQQHGHNPFSHIQDEGGHKSDDSEVPHHVGGASGAAARAADINPFLPADNEVPEGNRPEEISEERSESAGHGVSVSTSLYAEIRNWKIEIRKSKLGTILKYRSPNLANPNWITKPETRDSQLEPNFEFRIFGLFSFWESASLFGTALLAAIVYFQTGRNLKLQISPATWWPARRPPLRGPAGGAALENAPESGGARRAGLRAQTRFFPGGSPLAPQVPRAPAGPPRPPRTRAASAPGGRIRTLSLLPRTVRRVR